MDFVVEKSLAGTDHFVFGELGFVTEHEAGDWETGGPGEAAPCGAGWYAHRGQDGELDILGPFPSRDAAERALFGTSLGSLAGATRSSGAVADYVTRIRAGRD